MNNRRRSPPYYKPLTVSIPVQQSTLFL